MILRNYICWVQSTGLCCPDRSGLAHESKKKKKWATQQREVGEPPMGRRSLNAVCLRCSLEQLKLTLSRIMGSKFLEYTSWGTCPRFKFSFLYTVPTISKGSSSQVLPGHGIQKKGYLVQSTPTTKQVSSWESQIPTICLICED